MKQKRTHGLRNTLARAVLGGVATLFGAGAMAQPVLAADAALKNAYAQAQERVEQVSMSGHPDLYCEGNNCSEGDDGRYVESGRFNIPADGRVETRYSTSGDGSYSVQTAVGLAPDGAYKPNMTVPSCNQFSERFRLRDVTEVDSKGETTHYTSLGARFPGFNIGENTKITPMAWGVLGDTEGIGGEIGWNYRNLSGTLDAETRTLPSTATHAGGSLDYQITPSLKLGVGGDRISDDNGITTQWLVNGVYDINKNHAMGGSLSQLENPDGTTTTSLRGFGVRYGDLSWGGRFLGRVDFSPETNTNTYFGQLILAENSTTGKGGATFWDENKASTDGGLRRGIIPDAMSTEGANIRDRTSNGFAGSLTAKLADSQGSQSGFLRGELGYTHPDMFNGRLGLSGGIERAFADDAGARHSAMAGITYRGGDEERLVLEADTTIPIDNDGDPTATVMLRWRF